MFLKKIASKIFNFVAYLFLMFYKNVKFKPSCKSHFRNNLVQLLISNWILC